MTLEVIEISRNEHEDFLKSQNEFSFLQIPSWAQVKPEWKSFSIGFFSNNSLVGVGLVLARTIPKINYALWYLPEGPVLNEKHLNEVKEWVSALKGFAKGKKVFAVKFGPRIVENTFEKDQIKELQLSGVKSFNEVKTESDAIIEQLKYIGCRQENQAAGFGDFQPRYVFVKEVKQKSDEELLQEFNQEWRRNIKKAEGAQVEVTLGGLGDLALFHELYKETAKRDGFRPRPLNYFEKMFESLNNELCEVRLYLAKVDGVVHAATIWIRVKNRVWYSYGASSTTGRDFRPSNAIQWQMMRDARDAGAEIYDFRGISDSLEESHPLFGLLRFKLGTGGKVVKYIGEWDLVINSFVYRIFKFLMNRRSKK